MGKNVYLTGENAKDFSNALELLYSSINELNSVAAKMIPEKLLSADFTGFLNDFVKTVAAESKIDISFYADDTINNVDEDVKISIFSGLRIVFKILINFCNPQQMEVFLRKKENRLSVLLYHDASINVFEKLQKSIAHEIEILQSVLGPVNGRFIVHPVNDKGNSLEIQV